MRGNGYFGDANDITSEAVTPAQQAAWSDLIGRWERAAQQFVTAQDDLGSMADFVATQDAQTQSDYAALVARGNTIGSSIATMQTALADVKAALAGAWQSVTGVWQTYVGTPATANDVVTALSTQGIMGFGALGFLPLVPIAIVAAALAAVTYFLTDYATFAKKVALLKQGIPASQIAQATGGGLTSSLGTFAWIALGVAALVFLPKLISSFKEATR